MDETSCDSHTTKPAKSSWVTTFGGILVLLKNGFHISTVIYMLI